MMTDFNYKKYSLENLENWVYDAMGSGDATPQEIYDVIVNAVKDNYYTYKKQASEAYELLALLNGNGGWTYKDVMKEREYYEQSNMTEEELSQYKVPLSCDKDDQSPECQKSWTNFCEDKPYPAYVSNEGDILIPDYVVKKEDKVNRWVLPVQVGELDECYVNLPQDLLDQVGLKEGDMVHWIDRGDGSFELKKV